MPLLQSLVGLFDLLLYIMYIDVMECKEVCVVFRHYHPSKVTTDSVAVYTSFIILHCYFAYFDHDLSILVANLRAKIGRRSIKAIFL